MKTTNSLKYIIALICVLILQTQAYAQPREPRPMPPADRPDRIEQLQKDLNLSDTQIAKVKAILDEQKKEIEKLFKASENEHKATHEELVKCKKETDEKIAALLNSDQKEKFVEMQKQHYEMPNEQQQDDHNQPYAHREMKPRDCPPITTEGFVKELKKELNLTNEQESKIQKIFDAQSEEIEKKVKLSKKDKKIKREEMKKEHNTMREKMEKQRKETDAKISAVLTDEQKKKFEELQKKHSQMPPREERPDCKRSKPTGDECPHRNE